ncbi:involucrin-like isoform X7 [Anser cygnoides]|uniref:involucrin-like isoform X7 n=1 Tax=Anser cygnoides TaxID=8845 RepID=UPI0034D2AB04
MAAPLPFLSHSKFELKLKEATADELKHIAQLEEQLREEEEQRKVLRQELTHLQEDIEEKGTEHAWQQQMELQAVTQGCVHHHRGVLHPMELTREKRCVAQLQELVESLKHIAQLEEQLREEEEQRKVLRQELMHLQEDIEEKETEHAWQQQMELQAVTQGCVHHHRGVLHPMELTREKRCVAQLQELVESLKHIAQLEEQLREEEEQRKVLRQELRHLQEDIEEKETEHAWQQQMELQAVTQGCVHHHRGVLHPMELTREKRCVAQLQELVESLKHIAQLEEQLREEEEQRKVLRQELRHLQEDIEEKETEHAWQQQMELEAVAQGCVMSEVLEARLKTEELARRRGAISWLWTFCLIFLCVELAVTFMLGVAVLYASCYDREFFYHLLLHVLPEDTYTDLAHFLEETLSLVSEGVPPHCHLL